LDIGAKVYNSTGIAIPNNAWTELTFDSEKYDTDNIHSITTNTSRLTCQTSGKYLIVGNAQFDNDATGIRGYRILLNGTTILAEIQEDGMGFNVATISIIHDLNVNDYVEYHQVGSLDIIAFDDYSPYFMMQKIDGISANRIPIYDDSAFKVTGTALDFGDNISVVVTGSTAYISSALTEAALDIGARVYNSTGIVIPNGSWKELTFDSEEYDTDSIHSGSSSQLYCNTQGKYIIHGQVYWETSTSQTRGIRIVLNGSDIIADEFAQPAGTVGNALHSVTTIDDLSSGDYVTLEVLQTTSGDLDVQAENYFSPYFMMQKIDGISANRIPSFDENLDVDVTGSTAYVNLADTVVINDDIYTDVWQSFTGTYNAVGWSSFTSEIAEYKRVGNLVFVNFDIRGTSNSTGTQFTVPYTNEMGANATIVLLVQDNGSILHGQSEIAPGGDLIRFWKDLAFGQWTASGAKRVSGQIFYETT
jgi:hypothetical protein